MMIPPCERCGTTSREVARSTVTGEWTCKECYVGTVSREMPIEMGSLPSPPSHLSGNDDISLGGGSTPRFVAGVDKTTVRARQLGIQLPLGRRGPCVLPTHGPDHTSGMVPIGKGLWNYRCPACERSFSLAEIRAILAYATVPYGDDRDGQVVGAWCSVRPPGDTEVSRWAERLDFEAGLLTERAVPIVIPEGLSPAAHSVAGGVRLLLALRDTTVWKDETFTFARRFCRAWCGLADSEARAGVEELRSRRVLVRTGVAKRRAITYRLGREHEVDHGDDVALRENAFVDAIKEAFDAEGLPPDGRSSR